LSVSGRNRQARIHVDNGAIAARDEARCGSVGQPGECAGIEADHLIHLLDVRIEEGAVAGIPALFTSSVMRVCAQCRLDPGEIRLVVEIGCNRLDLPACLVF
jgi:hypothetical protein